jgi:4'-phosphopantetheinyl transferase
MRAQASWPSVHTAGRVWVRPRKRPAMSRGQLHVWRAELGRRMDDLPRLARALAPEEHVRASQFRFEQHRNEYLLAHGILRSLLGAYLNATPGTLALGCGPCGAPTVASGGLRFSMSRSHGLALFAFALGGALGVDVERVRPGVMADLARCMSPAGRRALEAIPRSARRRALFRAWARLEAHTKASGEGLDAGLGVFERYLGCGSPALVGSRGDDQRSWTLFDLDPSPRCVGALAAPPHIRRIRCFQWGDGLALGPTHVDSAPAAGLLPNHEVQDEDLSS